MTRTRTSTSRAEKKSRRRFLKTVAMGSVAAFAAATLPKVGEAAPVKRGRHASQPAAPTLTAHTPVEAEIEKQKKATADTVKTIRAFELPAGSEMAFVFSAQKAPRRTPGSGTPPAGGGTR